MGLEYATGDRALHECNPRCHRDVHFDVVYSYIPDATEELVVLGAELLDFEVIEVKKILEFPEFEPGTTLKPLGAFSMKFRWPKKGATS